MDAYRLRAKQILEHGRKQMLSGVLLHVIEAARPVDLRGHLTSNFDRRRGGEYVRDAVILIDDVDDVLPGQGAEVVKLSARCGIESGSVEVEPLSVLRTIHDPSGELGQVGIGVVESLGG